MRGMTRLSPEDRARAKEVTRLARLGKLPDAPPPSRQSSLIPRPLTKQEVSAAVFKCLYWMTGFTNKAAMARVYCLDRRTVDRNLDSKGFAPRPKTWTRLCRDATWRVEKRFDWSLVRGRMGDRLILLDNTFVEPDELPGPIDELWDRATMIESMGARGMARVRVAQMLGITTYSMVESEKWRRIAEAKMWQLAGYRVTLLTKADWAERTGVEWEPGFAFKAQRGYRDLMLPANPFDLIRTPLP